jgi:hypothetical protein
MWGGFAGDVTGTGDRLVTGDDEFGPKGAQPRYRLDE